jgi:hypothetical protein
MHQRVEKTLTQKKLNLEQKTPPSSPLDPLRISHPTTASNLEKAGFAGFAGFVWGMLMIGLLCSTTSKVTPQQTKRLIGLGDSPPSQQIPQLGLRSAIEPY